MKKEWLIKTLAIGIILLFICISITPLSAVDNLKKSSVPFSSGNILYVGGSGPGNYTSIQDAIDNSSDGNTVYVFDDLSPYYENVRVNKSITFLGENRETTIIDANGSGCPVYLEANNITISGFLLQHSGNEWYNDAGIHFKFWSEERKTNNNRIIGNKITNNYDGLFGYLSANNLIRDNIIINNRDCGIYFLGDCTSNVIKNNIIMKNNIGVYIQHSNFIQIIGNTIDNNNELGVHIAEDATLNLVKNNYIANSSSGIVLDSSGIDIVSNVITSNNIGLYLSVTFRCVIHRNNFIENNISATFYYESFAKMLALFLRANVFQMNKFFHNYWDDNYETPKVIMGKMFCFLFLSFLFGIETKTIEWKNYDWFPAKKPYDIEV
jgi:nitrous oxidase accessory protein